MWKKYQKYNEESYKDDVYDDNFDQIDDDSPGKNDSDGDDADDTTNMVGNDQI